MRQIMINDRLLGIGVKEARMEILGGMMPQDDTCRHPTLKKSIIGAKICEAAVI